MFEKIVIGYDGSDQARDALALGRMLSQKTGARLLPACVFHHELPSVAGWEEYEQGARADAERALGKAAATIAQDGPVETRAVGATSDARGLLDLATTEEADLLVVGSSHRGTIGRTVMGSVGERLLHGAPCPVAVAPNGFSAETQQLGVIAAAFDGSDESRSALREACELAQATGAALQVIAVAQPEVIIGYLGMPPAFDYTSLENDIRAELERELTAALDDLPSAVAVSSKVLAGSPPETIARECEGSVDLLIVGSRGYGPMRTVLLGSVSARLMRSAPCPVLVIPRGATSNG